MDIDARFKKLERENRRTKKIGAIAAVVVSVFIISEQAKTNKVVEGNQFWLLDDDAPRFTVWKALDCRETQTG